eukprot:1284627-Lingulodinium_polyedra.AAC.1
MRPPRTATASATAKARFATALASSASCRPEPLVLEADCRTRQTPRRPARLAAVKRRHGRAPWNQR